MKEYTTIIFTDKYPGPPSCLRGTPPPLQWYCGVLSSYGAHLSLSRGRILSVSSAIPHTRTQVWGNLPYPFTGFSFWLSSSSDGERSPSLLSTGLGAGTISTSSPGLTKYNNPSLCKCDWSAGGRTTRWMVLLI